MFNSAWMIAEKLISILGLIFVTSYVAKYVGAEVFGKIAFATSVFQITQVVAQLGSDIIIFKRISKNEKSGIRLLNATYHLRIFIYIVVSLPVLLFLYHPDDQVGFIFVFACFLSCFFSSLDVYSIYFDAKLQSKKNTIINAIGLTFSLLARWFIALLILNPILLSIPIICSGFVPYVLRRFYFKRCIIKVGDKLKHKIKYTKYLMSAGSSLVLSTLSVAVYTRLSMICVGYFLGSALVGVYSVAITLASAWSFVWNSFITSSSPSIFNDKDDDSSLRKAARLNFFVFVICCPIIISIYLFGAWFISIFYGKQFVGSFVPMIILCFATLLSALGTVATRFIAKYSGYAYLSKKMLMVVLIGLALNIIFINFYGLIGAAIATLLTEFISLTILNYFFKEGMILKLHKKTLSVNTYR